MVIFLYNLYIFVWIQNKKCIDYIEKIISMLSKHFCLDTKQQFLIQDDLKAAQKMLYKKIKKCIDYTEK